MLPHQPLQLKVFCSALLLSNIAKLVQKLLLHAQGIAAFIIFHSAYLLQTKY